LIRIPLEILTTYSWYLTEINMTLTGKLTSILTIIVTFIFASTVANATPVNYSEAADGDLTSGLLLNLDVGSNTVSGNQQETPTTANYESWSFVLGADLGISRINFVYDDPQGAFNPSPYPNQGTFSITGPGNSLIASNIINGNFSFSETYVTPMSDIGNYLVEITGDFVYPSASWTAVFEVVSLTNSNPNVSVAEPFSIALFLLGLVSLVGMRIRSKR